MIKKISFIILSTTLFLSSCNLPFGGQGDSNTGNTGVDTNPSTQAAQTVEALLTAQALQVPQNTATNTPATNVLPTNTLIPLPTNTSIPLATPTQNCDAMKFITDVTISDGTIMTPGQAFTKTWRLQNTGTCSWTPSYVIVFNNGNVMGGPSTQALAGNVNPGGTIDISANFIAPATNGDYTANYKIRNAAGVLFGQFYVQIKVGSSSGSDGPFAVTGVTYSQSTFTEGSYVNCPKITADITVNKAGSVTYHWIQSGFGNSEETISFSEAGTKSVSNKWYVGPLAPGPLWTSVYIDEPNHQDFSHFTVTPCTGYP